MVLDGMFVGLADTPAKINEAVCRLDGFAFKGKCCGFTPVCDRGEMIDGFRDGSCPICTDLMCFDKTRPDGHMLNCKVPGVGHQTESPIAMLKPPVNDVVVKVRADFPSLMFWVYAETLQPPLTL